MKHIPKFIFLFVLTLPLVSYAAGSGYFSDSLNSISKIMSTSVVTLLFGIAFLAFVIGLIRYIITGAHDEEKRAQGKNLMIWAVVGLAIMSTLFGIINIVSGIFNVDTGDTVTIIKYDHI